MQVLPEHQTGPNFSAGPLALQKTTFCSTIGLLCCPRVGWKKPSPFPLEPHRRLLSQGGQGSPGLRLCAQPNPYPGLGTDKGARGPRYAHHSSPKGRVRRDACPPAQAKVGRSELNWLKVRLSCGSERGSDWPQVTQQVRNRVGLYDPRLSIPEYPRGHPPAHATPESK